MRTDGYITSEPDSSYWAYSNLRDGIGAGADPYGDAWARVERGDGAIAGTKVDATGAVTDGPRVQFTSVDGLIDAVGAKGPDEASPSNLWIQWAGVSPQSLREVLIVWSQNIVLLNRAGIIQTGGPGSIEAVRIEGRLMVIAMSAPVAITGEQLFTFSFDAGTVGFYGTKPDSAAVLACETVATTGGSDALGTLPDPEICECSEWIGYTEGPSPGAGTARAVTDTLLFCKECVGTPPEERPLQGLNEDVAAAVNNGFNSVPVRCTWPFVLAKLYVGGCDGSCDPEPCPVWLISYRLQGTSVPMQTYALDKLVDLDPCDIRSEDIYGVLTSDVGCGETTEVEITVSAGPNVVISDQVYWQGSLPGMAGQSVSVRFKVYDGCGQTCVTLVNPDEAQHWVSEDIIKPKLRTIPIIALSGLGITTATVLLPTTYTTQTIPIITSIEYVDVLKDITPLSTAITAFLSVGTITQVSPYTSLLSTSGILLQVEGSVAVSPVTAINSATSTFKVIDSGTLKTAIFGTGGLVTSIGSTSIDVCIDGVIVALSIITAIGTSPVTPVVINDLTTSMATAITGVAAVTLAEPHFVIGVTTTPVVDFVTGGEFISLFMPTDFGETIVLNAVTDIDKEFVNVVKDIDLDNREIVLPDGDAVPQEVLKLDPRTDAPTRFLAYTEGQTDGIKLLRKPAKLVGTGSTRIPLPACGGPPTCLPTTFDYESDSGSLEDQAVTVLAPNMTQKPAGSENSCPCYTCVPELEITAPSGDEPEPPGPHNPCTVSVKRLQRDWCLRCTVG